MQNRAKDYFSMLHQSSHHFTSLLKRKVFRTPCYNSQARITFKPHPYLLNLDISNWRWPSQSNEREFLIVFLNAKAMTSRLSFVDVGHCVLKVTCLRYLYLQSSYSLPWQTHRCILSASLLLKKMNEIFVITKAVYYLRTLQKLKYVCKETQIVENAIKHFWYLFATYALHCRSILSYCSARPWTP